MQSLLEPQAFQPRMVFLGPIMIRQRELERDPHEQTYIHATNKLLCRFEKDIIEKGAFFGNVHSSFNLPGVLDRRGRLGSETDG